jgi:hypothetical protein
VIFLVPLENADNYLAAVGSTEYLAKPLHAGRVLNVIARQLQRSPVDTLRESLVGASLV